MKKFLTLSLFIVLVAVLSGCNMSEPITADSTGVWNHYFVYPLSLALTTVADWTGGNYGLSIIIVTIVIRFLILPLVLKQQKSMMAMQKLKPEMDALQAKYKDKKTPADQQKMQQELMQLYQTNKVNPMSGCLPMFVQMPIIMAFYYAIGRTTEIAEHSFFWVSLGQPDPYFILPVIAAITTFIQTRVSLTDQVQPQMKIVMNIIPIFILIAGTTLPSALALYWVIGNLFGIAQGLYLKKRMKLLKDADETAAVPSN
ncbi:Membrane protein insertase YidC 2 [Sutcliffiella rhizosphaerae]|uniref:Membrane protein insertase YidC n=2 Tax=Sutcliffiella rhizosphaerae TaxID=2880967 RepID=A0ABM8YSJ3_9BACI|nr:membrane protein insertase YidC [Sutcliffiella rhizosphaerae]CAG9622980.1 Membrane protein insertase YidC 2 [Sutcliffiella rhizosphaerae]